MKPLSIFKPIFVALFLILALECLQLLLDVNYYPNRNTSIETLASVVFLLVSIAGILAISSIILSWFIKRAGQDGTYLLAVLEVFSAFILGVSFAPAFILIYMENFGKALYFFWFTGHGLIPILIALSLILSRIYLKDRFKRIFYNLVDFVWKPAIIVTLSSAVWLIIFLATQTAPHVKTLPSKISSSSPQATINQRPNIILITFDSLSASDMSLYGYNRKTTPFWEEFAKESYVFERMHSNFHKTVPSVISMLTSKYPWTHGVFEWLESIKDKKNENIAAELRDEYYTAAIGPAMFQYPEFLGLKRQFDYNEWGGEKPSGFQAIPGTFSKLFTSRYSFPLFRHASLFKTNFSYILDEPFNDANEFLGELRERPFFLWLHLWPPHTPHTPPKPFKGTFLPADEEFNNVSGYYEEEQQGDVDKMRARYDELILFTDNALRKFIDSLKKSGQYDNSIIIVSADHGETLERGSSLYPSPLMYESIFHIPLLIHLPAQKKGVRVKALSEQIDLAPTILELVGKRPPEWMEGESLVPYMNTPASSSDKIKYSMVLFGEKGDSGGRGWWFSSYWKDYKLIHHMNTNASLLFKVKDGAQIETDLAKTERAVFFKMQRDLSKKIKENYTGLNRIHGKKDQ